MVPFGGWEMPLQYTSILDETRSVRKSAGIFDVSHMGRIDISGPYAGDFLGRLFSSAVDNLTIGRARYGVICNQEGGIIDDCIVYKREEQRFQLVPNAGNMSEILTWISQWVPDKKEIKIDDVTSDLAMIALQGPSAANLLAQLTPTNITSIRPFRGTETTVLGTDAFLARTGYTGEDGFELIIPSDAAQEVWFALTGKGATPCGLGARDLLRLEAGLLLHGNDIDLTTNPYEAGLSRFISPRRENYVALTAMNRILDEGTRKMLVGFRLLGRGIPRKGHAITSEGKTIGSVTSGSYSPTLDMSIGLGYVPNEFASSGTHFKIDIRGKLVEAQVADLPIYSRPKI